MTQHLGSGQTDNEFDLDRPLEGDIARLGTAKLCRQNRLYERGRHETSLSHILASGRGHCRAPGRVVRTASAQTV